MAPILCNAKIQNQNSYRLLRINITESPFFIPTERKKFAALLLYSLISEKVKARCSPTSLHHTSAVRSGSVSAHLSTISKAKLKLSGTFTEKFLKKLSYESKSLCTNFSSISSPSN